MEVLLEACCASVEEAFAADEAGIDRIELCAALPTGGVTPSIGMLEEVKARVKVPVVAMVRTREGRADPPEPDFRAAVRDVRSLVRAGADEIVCGVLAADGRVDRARNRELVEAAEGKPVAFHRVFDMTPDLDEALEALVETGFARVLTSGGEADVVTGLSGLRRLVQRSAGRLTILAGGGVRPENARLLVDAGCRELHFSMREASGRPGYGGAEDFAPLPARIAAMRLALGLGQTGPQ